MISWLKRRWRQLKCAHCCEREELESHFCKHDRVKYGAIHFVCVDCGRRRPKLYGF